MLQRGGGPAAEPCFEQTLCDVVGLQMTFGPTCPPGQFASSASANTGDSSACEICPADSFCVNDTQHSCKHNQYTDGSGKSSAANCWCRAGSYKNDATLIDVALLLRKK